MDGYLAELDPERREAMEALLTTVRGSYEEDLIGWAVAQTTVDAYIARYEASR